MTVTASRFASWPSLASHPPQHATHSSTVSVSTSWEPSGSQRISTAYSLLLGRWINANCSPCAVTADNKQVWASSPGSRAAPKLIGPVSAEVYRCWRRRRPTRQLALASNTCQPLRSARLRHTSGTSPATTTAAVTPAGSNPAMTCTTMTTTSAPSAAAVPSNPSRGRPGLVGLRQLP